MAITYVHGTREVEPGYQGIIHSLGGLTSQGSQGRVRQTVEMTCSGVADQGILVPANSRRICTFIFCQGAGDVLLALGRVPYTSITLSAGDYFQIDYRIPWTGAITITSSAASVIRATEISVQ